MSYIQNRPLLAFQTTTPLAPAGTYDSGILRCEGYSQLQTELLSDADGTLLAFYYSDSDGTDVVRTLSVPYTAANGYQLYSAPVFSPYVRYQFACPAGNTDFYYSTKFLATAISPQIARLDAPLVSGMMSYVNRSITVGQYPNGTYSNVAVTEGSNLRVALAEPLTAFGELRSVSISPVTQIDAIYGIKSNAETFVDTSPGTGSVSGDGGLFTCRTGVGVGGYGVIRTRRAIRYRPGQAAFYRFTALFDEGNKVALSLQAAGAFNSTNGFLCGFDGNSEFGVMHRTGGAHETRTLTLTVAATGAETLNLELNGVTYNIPVTNASLAVNAFEVAAWLMLETVPGVRDNQSVWDAWQNGATVVLFGRGAAALGGAYSVANGGGTIAGNIALDKSGAANIETWTYATDFSVDKLDGSGPSGMTIDPSKGNVFEIDLQYLGFGNVFFKVENPETGRFFTFHRFEFANARTTPTLNNPSLKVGWVAASLGSTTDLTVSGASAMGGVDGALHPFTTPRSFSFQRGSVTGTLISVFAIRVRSVFRGLVQLAEILPKIAYASPEGNKACTIKVLLNPTFDTVGGTKPNWQYIDMDESIAEYDTTGTTFTDTGDTLASFVVFGGTSSNINFVDLAEQGLAPLHLERGDVLCIAAQITGGAGSNVTASMTWVED